MRVTARLQLGFRTELIRYGLCRNLELPIQQPASEIRLSLRPLEEGDLASLFAHDSSLDGGEKKEIAWRLAFVACVGRMKHTTLAIATSCNGSPRRG